MGPVDKGCTRMQIRICPCFGTFAPPGKLPLDAIKQIWNFGIHELGWDADKQASIRFLAPSSVHLQALVSLNKDRDTFSLCGLNHIFFSSHDEPL
jgi:hypothetical protein